MLFNRRSSLCVLRFMCRIICCTYWIIFCQFIDPRFTCALYSWIAVTSIPKWVKLFAGTAFSVAVRVPSSADE